MSKNWHYATNGEKHGPVSAAQLKDLATTDQLSPDDLVWREDMKEWRKASTVKGLFSEKPSSRRPAPSPPSLPPKKKSRKLMWFGVASAFVIGAIVAWQVVLRPPVNDENEQGRTANESWPESGADDPAVTDTPKSASVTSEAPVVFQDGMDFRGNPKIIPESALTFRGRIFLPGGAQTHGEIRDARYCFSPDSKTIFMGANGRGAEHPIYAFDNKTGTLLSHIKKAHPRANAGGDSTLNIACSPDGRFIATGCSAGTIKVWTTESVLNVPTKVADSLHNWSIADPQRRSRFGEHSFSFSDDSTLLYFHVGYHFGCCNIKTGDMLFHDIAEMGIRGYNTATKTFWGTDDVGSILQWEGHTGAAARKVNFIRWPFRCEGCVTSGDGRYFLVLVVNAPDDDPRNVRGFECRIVDHNFAVTNTIALPERPLAIGLSYDGGLCVFSFGTRFTIHDTSTRQELVSVRDLYGQVSHFAFSPDGTRLLTSAFTQGLYVFDLNQSRSSQ